MISQHTKRQRPFISMVETVAWFVVSAAVVVGCAAIVAFAHQPAKDTQLNTPVHNPQ